MPEDNVSRLSQRAFRHGEGQKTGCPERRHHQHGIQHFRKAGGETDGKHGPKTAEQGRGWP